MIFPAYITLTRSAYRATTPRLCVMISIATPKRRERSFMSSRIWAWIVTSSAVVGSSARISEGLHATAIAIIIRCRMPPLNWCGYWARRRSGSGIPTMPSSSAARRRASAGVIPRWISSPSVSWRPIERTGLSEVIGSWNTMPISRPRTRRISSSESFRMSRPLKRTRPPTIRPAGPATRRMMLSALTLLPQPDSPTSATVSLSFTSQDTSSTARTTPPCVTKCVWRFLTSRRVPTAAQCSRVMNIGGSERRASRGAPAPPALERRLKLILAAGCVQMHPRARLERSVLPAHGLGHAGPAVLGRPAHALAPDPPAQVGVGDETPDAVGQRRDVAVGDEEARDAVADRRHPPADPGRDDRASAGHRFAGDHAEGLVVRGQDRHVGGDVVDGQHALGLGPDEANRVLQAQPLDAQPERRLVAIRRLVGFAAHDQEPQALPGRAQPRDRVEQRVEPLDRSDATDPQENRALVEPESAPRLGAVTRHAEVGVHAARDRRDSRRGGGIVAQELGALDDVRGHDAVGPGDDARLFLEPDRRLQLRRAPGHAVLQAAEGVKHLEHRRRAAGLERERGDAGEPVVSVDQVIVDRPRDTPRLDAVDKLVEMVVDALAGHRRLVARRQVDHAGSLAELHHPRDRRVLRAREDIDGDAHAPELARYLAHVDVHPAGFLPAESGQRAGVDAEHRDAQAHRILTAQTASATGSNSYLYRSSPRRKSKVRRPRALASRTTWARRTTPGESAARSGSNPEL